MIRSATQQALVRLLATQRHSLAMYLANTRPWAPPGSERALAAVRHIVEDQSKMASRIADHMIDVYGQVDSGEFPMEFTSVHDLGIAYLLERLVSAERHDLTLIEGCVRDLTKDPTGRVLAEESLGAARAHLEALEEIVGQHT